MDTYLDNLLSETSVRYGKPGGIAYHHISDRGCSSESSRSTKSELERAVSPDHESTPGA